MSEITTVLLCLQPLLSTSFFRQLTIISEALLMMQGRVTMLGISRWTRRGGSYRTIQRFFLSKINWETLHWALIKPRLTTSSGVILIVGDATTVTKSGQQTFGPGRFFSSISARAVPCIAFQTLSFIDVNQRCSWPVLLEQIVPKPPALKKKPVKQKSPAGQTPQRGRGHRTFFISGKAH